MTTPAPSAFFDLGMFTGISQYENFGRWPELLPSVEMAASTTPHRWSDAAAHLDLPSTYTFDGRTKCTDTFLSETDTAAVLVTCGGNLRFERYWLTGGPTVAWPSMSVAKSFVSALVGIAIDEGHIAGVDRALSDYVEVQPGSAYDGVAIKDILQMSSGARWNEDYHDPESDIYRLVAAMGADGSLRDFVATMVPERAPGTVCRYNSGDTQALGQLLVNATGRSLTDYMRDKLVEPLGFAGPAHWLVDSTGMEVAFAGLAVTARDYAIFGEAYRLGGRWRGRQVIPQAWVAASLNADADHLRPGQLIAGARHYDMGYGYQWWLPRGDSGEFSAIGIYNQFVYVDPANEVVIVKLSANPTFGTADSEAANREFETLAVLRAIATAAR